MPPDDRQQTRIAWLARVGGWILRLLGWTWRIRVVHDDGLKRLQGSGKPFIFSLWHGQLLPLLYQHRGQGVAVLISEHGDGEIVARMAVGLGYTTVRGSTSRGAARALLALTRRLEEGTSLAITPDGPRGPAKSIAPGVLVVAQRANAPLIAVAVSASSAWRLKSWDSFLIPRPFARLRIAYSDPLCLDAADARGAIAEVERLRAAMATAEARANG